MTHRLRALFNRLRSIFRRSQLERELDAEIASHVQLATEENLQRGLPATEARHQALIRFGGTQQAKEQHRDARGLPFLDTLLQDLRFAFRMLRKSPGFTAVAVLTLALGIGANTAIFSLIDAALLRSLPVRNPQQLVVFQWAAHKSPNLKGHYSYMSCPAATSGAGGEYGCWFSYPMFRQFQSLQSQFSNITGLCGNVGLDLRGNGPASFVQGEMVSGDFFDTLGIAAAVGRTFGPSDDTPSAPAVAVLGYGYWQSAFGGDPAAVGKTVWLNNVPVTIVGVAAKAFPSLSPATARAIWLPLSVSPQLGMDLYGNVSGDHPSLQAGDDIWWVYTVARLKEGITLDQAQAAASALFHNDVTDKTKEFFKPEDAPRLVLVPASQAVSGLRDQFSTPLAILMTAVGMVLLVACANVAGLMLARSATRQRELAVRLALGAGRGRIAGQLLTESVLLSVAGGIAGILLARWSVQSLVAFMSRGGLWPSHLIVHLDLRVLLFTALASVFTGILFGLAPVFRGLRLDLTPALKASSTSLAVGPKHGGWLSLGGTLVVAQVALAILILSGAGLLIRTLRNLKSVNPGFDTRNILLFRLDPALNGYDEPQSKKSKDLYSELLSRLEGIPGVISATYSFDDLLSGNAWTTSFGIEGESHNTTLSTLGLQAGPRYFETMGIPLMTGRLFTAQDFSLPPDPKWEPVVINESFARTFLPGQNPLGRHITGVGHHGTSREIVGVVGDTKFLNVRNEMAPTLFIPAGGGEAVFEVRTAVDPRTIIPAVHGMVSQLDSNLPLFSVRTETEQIDRSFFQERMIARLSSFFGALSLLLACIGLYGLLSYEVSRKTNEIGVRMALGARPRDVVRLIVRQGIALSAVGTILGLLGALGAMRYIASLLYGVRPYDPLTFAAVALLLAIVALAACYIPARRAMRVDPMVALRYE